MPRRSSGFYFLNYLVVDFLMRCLLAFITPYKNLNAWPAPLNIDRMQSYYPDTVKIGFI